MNEKIEQSRVDAEYDIVCADARRVKDVGEQIRVIINALPVDAITDDSLRGEVSALLRAVDAIGMLIVRAGDDHGFIDDGQ